MGQVEGCKPALGLASGLQQCAQGLRRDGGVMGEGEVVEGETLGEGLSEMGTALRSEPGTLDVQGDGRAAGT